MNNDKKRNFDCGRLLFCGYEDCEPGHLFGPAVRDYYIIHYITEGRGWFEDEYRRYDLSKGDGFLIVPSAVTTYCADNCEPWKYSWVAFEEGAVVKYLNDAGINKKNPVFVKTGIEAGDCFYEMKRHFGKGGNECKLLSCMYRFLSILTDGKEEVSIQENYVNRAAEFMKYNFYKGITATEAAKFVGIDRAYLSRLFSEYTAMSPAEYLLKLRMEEAERLLGKSNLRIGDISAALGYSDQFVFSKAFSKYFGMPPSEMRKKTVRSYLIKTDSN